MESDRLSEERLDALLEVPRGVIEVDLVVDLPISYRFNRPAADAQEVPARKFADALEEGLAVEAELEDKVVLQTLDIGLDRRNEGQQRLSLGREVENVADHRVIQR